MRRRFYVLGTIFIWTWSGSTVLEAADDSHTSIVQATAGMKKYPGFITLYTNPDKNQVYLEVPAGGSPDLLYQPTLATGFGAADLTIDGQANGQILDRGYLGASKLVTFREFADHVLLVQRNTSYFTPSAAFGALGDSGAFFPDAVAAAFDIKGRDGDRLVIDATSFFRQDSIGLSNALKANGQGDFKVEDDRVALDFKSATSSESSSKGNCPFGPLKAVA